MPLTLLADYRFTEVLPFEVGTSATLDTRFVSASSVDNGTRVDTTGFTAGLLLGVYARGYYELWSQKGSELRIFGEVATRFGLRRSAYVVDGQREQDSVVTFDSGFGLEWRWR